jgi:hypothetical protein
MLYVQSAKAEVPSSAAPKSYLKTGRCHELDNLNTGTYTPPILTVETRNHF